MPRYLGQWDIGIMPFARNEATRFVSPTQTPEFLAAGLPIVSTPIADVRGWGDPGLVEIADGPEAFVSAIETVRARPKRDWLARVDRRLAQNSWDATWANMQAIMRQALAGAGTVPY